MFDFGDTLTFYAVALAVILIAMGLLASPLPV